MRAPLAPFLATTLLTAGAEAWGADDEQGVVVRADRVQSDRARIEDGSRFATSIDVRARGNDVDTLADILDEAPGLQARRTGDGLSPTFLTLRGAPAGHLTVAVDGVVLNDASGETVDISLLAPALIERADVYRGVAPLRLGTAGLGGAVDLVTRAPGARPFASVNVAYGSFNSRRASVAIGGAVGPVQMSLALGYRGTDGGFEFYDDHNTPLNPNDDRTSTRLNNDGNAFSLLYRLCLAQRTCLVLTHDWRERGVPGPGAEQLTTPRLSERRALAHLSHRVAVSGGFVEPFVAAGAHVDRLVDLGGQLVAGQMTDVQTTTLFGEVGALGRWRHDDVRVEPVVRVRGDHVDTGQLGAPITSGGRLAGAVGLEVTLDERIVEATAGVAAEPTYDLATTAVPAVGRVLLSPRGGVRVRVHGLEIRANVAHLERAPSLLELFGVAPFFLPNPTLRPERSENADLGFVLPLHARRVSVRLEGAGFVRAVEDLIVTERRGAIGYKAFNLSNARVAGVEAMIRAAFAPWIAATVSYAYTRAVTHEPGSPTDGAPVPGIPEHDLYARIDGTLGLATAWVDVSSISGVYFDETQLNAAPPRTLLGAGISVALPFARSLRVGIQCTNLLDERSATVGVRSAAGLTDIRQPIADFAGYPLPGRSCLGSLAYTTETPR